MNKLCHSDTGTSRNKGRGSTGPDGGGPRPIDENLREGQDFVLTRSGDVVLAPRRLRWTIDEVLLNVNRMEEEPGENLVGYRIGEEINCSGFFFF